MSRPTADAPMDFVFVIDEISTLLPGHDTSVALMEAAQLRGHRVLVTTAPGLEYRNGTAMAPCTPVQLRPAVLHEHRWVTDPQWYTAGEPLDYRLSDASVLFMRVDPPVDDAYLRATFLLDLVDRSQTLVVNSPSGLREANEKLFGLQVDGLMPPTVVTADRGHIRETVEQWGRAVLKPTNCMAGRGILILDPDDPNLASLLDNATERGTVQVVVQQWVERVHEGDRRVIVLDGQPIGVVRRVAQPGDFRCNMATGAAAVADTVTDADLSLCDRLAPYLRLHGLTLVGLDVIGDWVTEINVTSPTGVREIDALSGSHLSNSIIEWAESNCPRTSKKKETTQ
ncbi:MAG TPA: glutathione synthase [Nocardioidaceae bacterium]|nr:glutathione synthase [Nocardioidaceae bacterium]